MMKQLKSLLSILCAITLLVSGMTFALADEETAEAPAVQANTPAEAPAAPAQEPAAPAQEPAAPAKEPAAPAQEPAAPAKEPAAPAQEPAAPAQEPAAPAQEPAAPAQEPAAPAQEPAAPVQEPAAPVQEPAAPAQEPAAPAEEPAAPAQDEGEPETAPAENEGEEASSDDGNASEDGLYVLDDDNWGHIDPEVLEENVPEITDELKGLRNADLYVGDALSDTLEYGEELTVTLKGCNTSVVGLRLYAASGAAIHTKVDGKAVSFTPADSDIPSMSMYVYDLANAAGRTHEIVLSSNDTVSFRLAAVAGTEETTDENTAEDEIPASEEENNTSAEEPASGSASGKADHTETPAPTVQASVKTYDALKPGSSVSDSLIGGQKARIQVKCGKNENVTLTLRADSDNVVVTIDGGDARFVSAGGGTYTYELKDVPFRKFNVSISAKQDVSFTLSAVAVKAAEEEKKEEVTEKPAETEGIPETEPAKEEEKQEELPADNKAEAEEPAAVEEGVEEKAVAGTENESGSETDTEEEIKEEDNATNEDTAEKTGDETEEQPAEGYDVDLTDEEPADEASGEKTEEAAEEETKEESEEGSEEKPTEEAEEESEEQPEETEESEEKPEEETEEETGEESEEESEEEPEEETEEEPEEETEEESEEEPEEETAEGLTEEQMAELGYRKVRIANENGADIYAAAEEDAEVTGHADAGTELWIKDAEAEGWAEIYTEEETVQFILLADIERVKTVDEQMAELGYRRIQILNENGADIYAAAEEGAEVTGHADAGTELWIKDAEAEGWAEIYTEEEADAQFIRLADIEREKTAEEMLAELGYRKTRVMNEDGADIYAAADEEAEVIGHADFEAELWIKDAEAEGWAEIYTEEETAQFVKLADLEHEKTIDEILTELGYRKVQVLNQNGTDIYDSTEEEAAVIGHAEFESEIWIKDLEIEGWAEVYNEEGIQQFVRLDEIGKQMPSDEEMLEAGYIKVYVAIDIGANVYAGYEEYEGEEPVDHLEVGTVLWVELIDGADRARIFDLDEDAPVRYINLVDIIATLKPEGMEDLPVRELELHSNLEGSMVTKLFVGAEVHLWVDLVNFREDDKYEVKWQYSADGEEFFDIPDASELEFVYVVDNDNGKYTWKVIIKLISEREDIITAEE